MLQVEDMLSSCLWQWTQNCYNHWLLVFLVETRKDTGEPYHQPSNAIETGSEKTEQP